MAGGRNKDVAYDGYVCFLGLDISYDYLTGVLPFLQPTTFITWHHSSSSSSSSSSSTAWAYPPFVMPTLIMRLQRAHGYRGHTYPAHLLIPIDGPLRWHPA